ncbi:MAG: hypothetical protein WC467_03105 [Patescibacteria group bacterium]
MEKTNRGFRYYWGFIQFMLVVLSFVVCMAFLSRWTRDKARAESLENKWQASLFLPHCGNFEVETTVVEEKDGEILTSKKYLKNVTYAQLRLYPTIGCDRPVLFYLTDDSQQINQVAVDEARIINK